MIEDCTGKLHSSNTVSVCNASVQWIVLYAVFWHLVLVTAF